jgi:hypothetical protein
VAALEWWDVTPGLFGVTNLVRPIDPGADLLRRQPAAFSQMPGKKTLLGFDT